MKPLSIIFLNITISLMLISFYVGAFVAENPVFSSIIQTLTLFAITATLIFYYYQYKRNSCWNHSTESHKLANDLFAKFSHRWHPNKPHENIAYTYAYMDGLIYSSNMLLVAQIIKNEPFKFLVKDLIKSVKARVKDIFPFAEVDWKEWLKYINKNFEKNEVRIILHVLAWSARDKISLYKPSEKITENDIHLMIGSQHYEDGMRKDEIVSRIQNICNET